MNTRLFHILSICTFTLFQALFSPFLLFDKTTGKVIKLHPPWPPKIQLKQRAATLAATDT